MENASQRKITGVPAWLVAFAAGAVLELASYLAYFKPALHPVMLIVCGLAAALLAIRDLRYAFAFLLIETVVGSHGHYFFIQLGGFQLTVRMVLFAVLVIGWCVWSARNRMRTAHFLHARIMMPLLLLVAAVLWGIVRGLVDGHGLGATIDDAKAYAFLLLIPIALALVSDRVLFSWLTRVFAGALLWLAAKSLLLLYVFSHDFRFYLPDLYAWQRKFWLTEITRFAGGGLVRVFAASDVFAVIGVAVGVLAIWAGARRAAWWWSAFIQALFLISLSRSFWLGLAGGFLFVLPILLREKIADARAAGKIVLIELGTIALAAGILLFAVKFPYPAPLSDASMLSFFSARFEASDAAVSSRWNLLRPLESRIAVSPILGSGFGATVTYRSDDPRIQSLYPGGVITTGAIEWQYLELWLKMGILGLAAVAWLWWRFGRTLLESLRRAEGSDRALAAALLVSFLAFVIANIFTPYVNHPLGWMFLALLAAGARAVHSSTAPTKSG